MFFVVDEEKMVNVQIVEGLFPSLSMNTTTAIAGVVTTGRATVVMVLRIKALAHILGS